MCSVNYVSYYYEFIFLLDYKFQTLQFQIYFCDSFSFPSVPTCQPINS